jgi:hypothetical protein
LTTCCRPALGRRNIDLAGPPYSIFRRALAHNNLLAAEAAAKELPPLNLSDAFEVCGDATIDEAAMVAACLAFDADGKPDFPLVCEAVLYHRPLIPLTFVAFDVLSLGRVDLDAAGFFHDLLGRGRCPAKAVAGFALLLGVEQPPAVGTGRGQRCAPVAPQSPHSPADLSGLERRAAAARETAKPAY